MRARTLESLVRPALAACSDRPALRPGARAGRGGDGCRAGGAVLAAATAVATAAAFASPAEGAA